MQMKLANVYIENTSQYATKPAMWVRGDSPAIPRPDVAPHAFQLMRGHTYDFTTFYGALSVRKWDRYTNAKDYSLRVTANGKARVTLTSADAFAYTTQGLDDSKSVIFDDDVLFESRTIDVPSLARNKHGLSPVLVGFKVEVSEDCDMIVRDAGWYASVDEEDVRDVHLAVCTTTFKKEGYIRANIARVRKGILYGGRAGDYARYSAESWYDDISTHFTLNIVDNGRTLDVNEVSGNGVNVYPNDNAGGAGGFARGMIEAAKQDATHVLLMDDDVSFSVESFVRTYNVLRIVRDEYKGAFVSGAMMSAIEPEVMSEDTGFMSYDGYCHATKPCMRMDVLHDVVTNESFAPPLYRPDCQDLRQDYAAWWYCCIPIAEVRRRGMPLPLFVRFDDVEYSLRDHNDGSRKFITMNGINVWHEPFFSRYDGAVERYQTARNGLIISHASDVAQESDFMKMIHRSLQLELKRLNYDDAELVLEGLEDFLDGPDVTFAPGFAQRRYLETHKAAEGRMTFEEARPQLEALGVNIDDLEPDDILTDYMRSNRERLYDYLTYSGHGIIIHRDTGTKKVSIMERSAGAYQPGNIRLADVIVAVDIPNKLVSIRHRDNDRFDAIIKRYKEDMREYRTRMRRLHEDYQDAAKRMRTVAAWIDYLGLGEERDEDDGNE